MTSGSPAYFLKHKVKNSLTFSKSAVQSTKQADKNKMHHFCWIRRSNLSHITHKRSLILAAADVTLPPRWRSAAGCCAHAGLMGQWMETVSFLRLAVGNHATGLAALTPVQLFPIVLDCVATLYCSHTAVTGWWTYVTSTDTPTARKRSILPVLGGQVISVVLMRKYYDI